MNEIFHNGSLICGSRARRRHCLFLEERISLLLFFCFSQLSVTVNHLPIPVCSSILSNILYCDCNEKKRQFLRPGWQLSNILQVNTAAILGIETAYMNGQVCLVACPSLYSSLSVIMCRSITLTSLCPPKEASRCIYSLNSRTVLITFAWFIVKAFWMQSAGKHASLCSLFNN